MARITPWTKPQAEISKRLAAAVKARSKYEQEWLSNEATVFATRNGYYGGAPGGYSMLASGSSAAEASEEVGDLYLNFVSRDVRYTHSLISSNPPVVAPKPLTNDPSDKRAAEVADNLVHYAVRAYGINEKKDLAALQTLVLGTSFMKSFWNPELGDPIDVDASGKITMQGDYDLQVCNTWDIYPDPEAKSWDAVRYVFQRHHFPLEQALYMFPESEGLLQSAGSDGGVRSLFRQNQDANTDVVEVWEYWEKGSPINGFQGRHCWHLRDGKPLSKIIPSPHYYSRSFDAEEIDPETGEPIQRSLKIATLPFIIWTDLDLPDTYWGMSLVSYTGEAQETLNKFVNQAVDIMRAVGTPKLIVHESAEIDEADLSNSPFDVLRIKGPLGAVYKMDGGSPSPAMMEYTQFFKQSIMELAGANESTYGQQSRETSAYAMQWASQQTQAMRRRLFIKYTSVVEQIYKDYLNTVREYWDTARTIKIISDDQAFSVIDIEGADIAGGWDIAVEYGTNLSLDPSIRREELLNLRAAGVTQGAGISDRQLLKYLRLSNFSGMIDASEQAGKRQHEICLKMAADRVYIAPRKLQQHDLMLEWLNDYIMTSEFRDHDEEVKELIERHLEERTQMAGETAAAAAGPAAGGAPAGLEALLGGGGAAPEEAAPSTMLGI